MNLVPMRVTCTVYLINRIFLFRSQFLLLKRRHSVFFCLTKGTNLDVHVNHVKHVFQSLHISTADQNLRCCSEVEARITLVLSKTGNFDVEIEIW